MTVGRATQVRAVVAHEGDPKGRATQVRAVVAHEGDPKGRATQVRAVVVVGPPGPTITEFVQVVWVL